MSRMLLVVVWTLASAAQLLLGIGGWQTCLVERCCSCDSGVISRDRKISVPLAGTYNLRSTVGFEQRTIPPAVRPRAGDVKLTSGRSLGIFSRLSGLWN